MGMLINYLKIGAIVKYVRNNFKEASIEEKLQYIESEMIKKGFSHKDFKECMSFILMILNEDKKQSMAAFMREDTVAQSMEDRVR